VFNMKTDVPNSTEGCDNAAVFPTFQCTLACPECSAKEGKARKSPVMTMEDIEKFYWRLREQNVKLKHLRFSGGEPTLWPHLRYAIRRAKELDITNKVIVFSNGLNRTAADYGEADLVRVTHYGATNRRDILRLKKELGRRLRVSWTVHIPYSCDTDVLGDLPAKCGSQSLCFAHGKVYPCCYTAVNGIGGFPLDDNFYALCCNSKANEQEVCRKCWANPSLFKQIATPLTAEWGIWESPYGGFLSLPWRFVWLRRFLAGRYVRRWFAGGAK
jgi:sulfatase maturation enzyme AslB (radical SAM superfamily)